MQRGRHGLNTARQLWFMRASALPASLLPLSRCPRWYSSSAPQPADDVAILGGGITGLACAYYLTQQLPKTKITIYEASDRLGGWLLSKRVPVKDGTVLFEAGPRTLRPSSNGVLSARLLQELDIANDAIFTHKISPAARNRYLYYPDHLVRMPHPSHGLAENLYNLLREPIFSGAIWAGFTEILKNPRSQGVQDESVGAFFSRRFSKPMVDRLVSGIIHGIYAGDVWQLSAKSLFNGLWRSESEQGSVVSGFLKNRADGLEVTRREAEYLQEMKGFQWNPLLKATLAECSVFTLKDGLSSITDALARYLMGAGTVEFKTATAVESIKMSDDAKHVTVRSKGSSEAYQHAKVISTMSPNALNTLHEGHDTRLIPDIPSVTVMTVNLYFRTPNLCPEGFGYLIPLATPFENNPERALGVVFDTAYSPSPADVDTNNWEFTDVSQLQQARERGQLVNVNGFSWYNMPEKPNIQDSVEKRGTKLTVMLGGHWWNGWPSFPDEQEGLAMARSLLERHLGIKEEPEAWQVNLQKDCIPQYTVGHEQRLKTAHNNIWREYRGRLRVAGSWMAGVGCNDSIRSAWDVVRSLREGKDGTGLEQVGTAEYVRLKPIRPGRDEPQS